MKLYRILIVLAILAIAGVAEARLQYIIHYRNGREIVVSKYKEVGDQIKFYRLGGWMSVPKDRIAEIEDLVSGETRVFNPHYNEQDTKALRKSQADRLKKIMRKQSVRDSADEYREWEKDKEGGAKRKTKVKAWEKEYKWWKEREGF